MRQEVQLISDIHETADLESAVEYCYQQNWTDGLPVIPPTPKAVERILRYLQREPQDIIGIMPPRDGVVTIEAVAVNCVMAGCRPEYVPLVIAALEAILEERFNLNGVQTTTHSCAPLVMVSGPAVKAMKFNTREGAFGNGCRPSAAIGRAVRLALWNIGGGYPGNPCKTTLSHPGYYSFCIAEDPDDNPWEALHVERDFDASDTVVTVTATEGPHLIATGAGYSPAEDVLYILADEIAVLGSPLVTGGDLVLVLGPMAAKKLADAGMSKLEVKRSIMKLATRPVRDMRKRRAGTGDSHPMHWSTLVDMANDNAPVPFIRNTDNLVIIVTGGWGTGGAFCALCPGWGVHGGFTTSKRVIFPND